jgi:hypothetical protein
MRGHSLIAISYGVRPIPLVETDRTDRDRYTSCVRTSGTDPTAAVPLRHRQPFISISYERCTDAVRTRSGRGSVPVRVALGCARRSRTNAVSTPFVRDRGEGLSRWLRGQHRSGVHRDGADHDCTARPATSVARAAAPMSGSRTAPSRPERHRWVTDTLSSRSRTNGVRTRLVRDRGEVLSRGGLGLASRVAPSPFPPPSMSRRVCRDTASYRSRTNAVRTPFVRDRSERVSRSSRSAVRAATRQQRRSMSGSRTEQIMRR